MFLSDSQLQLPCAVSQSIALGSVAGGAATTRRGGGEGEPQDAVPSLSSIGPLPAPVGGGRFILSVVGSHFTNGQSIRWICPSCSSAQWRFVRYRSMAAVSVVLKCRCCSWTGGRGVDAEPVGAVVRSLELGELGRNSKSEGKTWVLD